MYRDTSQVEGAHTPFVLSTTDGLHDRDCYNCVKLFRVN